MAPRGTDFREHSPRAARTHTGAQFRVRPDRARVRYPLFLRRGPLPAWIPPLEDYTPVVTCLGFTQKTSPPSRLHRLHAGDLRAPRTGAPSNRPAPTRYRRSDLWPDWRQASPSTTLG